MSDYVNPNRINVAQSYPDLRDIDWSCLTGTDVPEFFYTRREGGSCRKADGTVSHITATSWCCLLRKLQKKHGAACLDPTALSIRLPNPKLPAHQQSELDRHVAANNTNSLNNDTEIKRFVWLSRRATKLADDKAGYRDCVEASVDFYVRAMRRHWSDLAATDEAVSAADKHTSSRKRQREFVDAYDSDIELTADDFKRQA